MDSEVCKTHVTYLSHAVASNALTLHLITSPLCTGINIFECGDHFHIGHRTKADKEFCVMRSTPIRRQ